MARRNNYLIQAGQAKARFLTYDHGRLARKLDLAMDEQYIYVNLLCQPYRVSRATGDLERQVRGQWTDGNSYEEVMTLLDLLCDSREDRWVSGRWKDMQAFGNMFHRNLLEDQRDPAAERIQQDVEGFRRACLALGGQPLAGGDAAYAIELACGLPAALRFWEGDEEFPARLRFQWDENACQFIRYETMYFAKALILRRIGEEMAR